MAIQNKIFPLEVSEFQHAVKYSTTIVVGANGQEVRNANWQDALRKYNAKFSIKKLSDLRVLIAFFHTVKGRETAFLLKDYADFKIRYDSPLGQGLHGVADQIPNGVRTSFQIFKIYEDALGNYVRRNVGHLTTGTVVIKTFLSGAETNYNPTVNLTTGMITFALAPPTNAEIYAQGEFRVPVRFDTDELPVDLMAYWINQGNIEQGYGQIPDIPLMEVRD